ncbi:hypothetical protein GQ600_13728 [Phytophthora cactorum]|nr:hypothetical protein GQ600_13728 [Phytophthora cactorum]
MPNALHMYPSVALLLWIWATGVILQSSDQDDATDCASTARDRRTSEDVPELITRRHSTATVESVKEVEEAAKPKTKPAPTCASLGNSHSVMALANVITTTIVLKLRTGSYVEQPYEWYSLENTGKDDIINTCKFRDAMAECTEFRTLDPTQQTVVYVVPFDYNHVLELKLDQMVPIVEPCPNPGRRRARRARPVDEITLFPYLWHSLLGPYFDPRVETPAANLGLELRSLPAKSNLLVSAQSLDCINRFFENDALPSEPRVGFLTLSKESCNNPNPERFLDNAAINFGLIPYGDCALLEHGFPLNAHHLNPPPPLATGIGRKFLLNLMVSWTMEKPTRVQAMMAALQVCGDLERATRANSRRCVVEHNDMLFKVLQAVDKRLGTAWRWYLSAAPAAYVSTLQQKNPEQYRIWEALSSGSIPIVEELQRNVNLLECFTTRRTLIRGAAFLKTFTVCFDKSNGDNLSTSSKENEQNSSEWGQWTPTEELLALQARTRSWYVGLNHHLQSDLIDKVMTHFAETS